MRRADRLLRDRLREKLLVTLTSGETFRGLLFEVDDKSLVLLEPHALRADGTVVKVDGTLILPRDKVAYMQRP